MGVYGHVGSVLFSASEKSSKPYLVKLVLHDAVIQVAELCCEYNGRTLKFYPDIASVTIRPCYFSPHTLSPESKMLYFVFKINERERKLHLFLV